MSIQNNLQVTGSASDLHPGLHFKDRCPLCGPALLRVLPYRYDFHGRFLYGVTCSVCTLAFLHPMPEDEEIARMYNEAYFTECSETCGAHGPRAYMEMVEVSAAARREGALRIDRCLVDHLGARGVLCEVGCGPGHFLAGMREVGWGVRGLEISEFAARHAREKLHLEVAVGAITAKALPPASVDAVFLGDVLEHLPRPLEALGAIREWLRPGGVAAVAVPSTLNLLSARLGMTVYNSTGRWKTLRIPPYHLFEYTPVTLRAMLEAAGYRTLEVRQSAVPIRRMGLRGTGVENAGKVTLQLLAHATSRLFNRGGDRLFAVARKGVA